jgi:hypothetical protein
MGSTDTDSSGELHKMNFFPDEKVYAVYGGRLERAADLFPTFVRASDRYTDREPMVLFSEP